MKKKDSKQLKPKILKYTKIQLKKQKIKEYQTYLKTRIYF